MVEADKVKNILNSINYILKAITITGGIIVWFMLPANIPIHFNRSFEPDSYGSKVIILIAFALPLISFIPFAVELPDKNIVTDKNMYNMLVLEEQRKAAMKKLVLTALMSILFWMTMILVLKNI